MFIVLPLSFRNFRLTALKKFLHIPHIYLPATVLLEYEKHCRNEFKKMERRVTKAKREINIKIESAKNQITTLLKVYFRLGCPIGE